MTGLYEDRITHHDHLIILPNIKSYWINDLKGTAFTNLKWSDPETEEETHEQKNRQTNMAKTQSGVPTFVFKH